ncbi:MAG TPA: DUF4282 domain-containing protein [Dongiaceae bacterium]|nr:DUF4282 domain-containing protein [Dongiaceae bacterium]
MQWLLDVITLKFFITPYLIVLIYWFGALVVPLVVWLVCRWLLGKLREHELTATGLDSFNQGIDRLPRADQLRGYFWIAFTLGFLFLELLWRLLFEFLIAYFHIHDALIQISRQ